MLVEITRTTNNPKIFTNIPKRMFNSVRFQMGPIRLEDFDFTNAKEEIENYDPREKVSVRPAKIRPRAQYVD